MKIKFGSFEFEIDPDYMIFAIIVVGVITLLIIAMLKG